MRSLHLHNNYTVFITEADTRPKAQQSDRDRKDVAPYKGVSILDQHEF